MLKTLFAPLEECSKEGVTQQREKILNKSGNRSVLKQLRIIYYRKTDDYTNIPANEPEVLSYTRTAIHFTILVEVAAEIL